MADPDRPVYVASEAEGVGRFEIRAGADVCGEVVAVDFDTRAVTATTGSDFTRRHGAARFHVVHTAPPELVDVPIIADGRAEDALERFRVELSGVRNGSIRPPATVPFLIIDADGSPRAAFGAGRLEVSEIDGTVAVPVYRAGPAGAAMEVPFSASGSGAAPAGEDDYRVTTAAPLTFAPGERSTTIEVELVDDGLEEPVETLELVLLGNAAPVASTLELAIGSGSDDTAPRSRFHHPRDGWSYAADDYRIRELHVFTRDGGSGVRGVDIALRRNDRDGRCAWWTGSRFSVGACGDPRFVRMTAFEPGWFYGYRIEPLRPSVGTSVRSYTAYARATDAAGNVEVADEVGRTRNTFEVARARTGSR
jgi:hypothetical protein